MLACRHLTITPISLVLRWLLGIHGKLFHACPGQQSLLGLHPFILLVASTREVFQCISPHRDRPILQRCGLNGFRGGEGYCGWLWLGLNFLQSQQSGLLHSLAYTFNTRERSVAIAIANPVDAGDRAGCTQQYGHRVTHYQLVAVGVEEGAHLPLVAILQQAVEGTGSHMVDIGHLQLQLAIGVEERIAAAEAPVQWVSAASAALAGSGFVVLVDRQTAKFTTRESFPFYEYGGSRTRCQSFLIDDGVEFVPSRHHPDVADYALAGLKHQTVSEADARQQLVPTQEYRVNLFVLDSFVLEGKLDGLAQGDLRFHEQALLEGIVPQQVGWADMKFEQFQLGEVTVLVELAGQGWVGLVGIVLHKFVQGLLGQNGNLRLRNLLLFVLVVRQEVGQGFAHYLNLSLPLGSWLLGLGLLVLIAIARQKICYAFGRLAYIFFVLLIPVVDYLEDLRLLLPLLFAYAEGHRLCFCFRLLFHRFDYRFRALQPTVINDIL